MPSRHSDRHDRERDSDRDKDRDKDGDRDRDRDRDRDPDATSPERRERRRHRSSRTGTGSGVSKRKSTPKDSVLGSSVHRESHVSSSKRSGAPSTSTRKDGSVSTKKTSTSSVSKREDNGSKTDLLPERSSTVAESSTRHRSTFANAKPELQRRASSTSPRAASRASIPYPSFSKAHSREAVSSRDNLPSASRHSSDSPAALRKNVYTPDPTDLQHRKNNSVDHINAQDPIVNPAPRVNAPPSPPLTAQDPQHDLDPKRQSMQVHLSTSHETLRDASHQQAQDDLRAKTSPPSQLAASPNAGNRHATVEESSSNMSVPRVRQGPQRATPLKTALHAAGLNRSSSDLSVGSPASKLKAGAGAGSKESHDDTTPRSASISSDKTTTPTATRAPYPLDGEPRSTATMPANEAFVRASIESITAQPPPPPPAPALAPPRVDYLMQHGGLPRTVPKQFLFAPEPSRASPFSVGDSPNTQIQSVQVERFFAPFSGILDDFTKVMTKNGSVAVATGYRSVARRLLDRLEAVFARDISSETCDCVVCSNMDDAASILTAQPGVSWGDILEYVSGRRELPVWPPFVLHNEPALDRDGHPELNAPMQKLDIDVPDEYRDHYIRQSKKIKQSVDRWLASQGGPASDAPPVEADDDTLTFAILTHLAPNQRSVFRDLLGITAQTRPPSIHPASRGPSSAGLESDKRSDSANGVRNELLDRTSLAVQRLYRLATAPRAAECAIYLLQNPTLHHVLATLAAVSDGEWDILTSGRFDGFLRSGAEDLSVDNAANTGNQTRTSIFTDARSRASAGPTHGVTPSLGASSAQDSRTASASGQGVAGGPVAIDEDTEILALGEVEREIFLGMEALEDAFEALHVRAEAVRRDLRDRAAGLSLAAQIRRHGHPASASALAAAQDLDARLGTPSSAVGVDELGADADGNGHGLDSSTDDDFDLLSEIAPDDSASCVSRSRVRRPKRREERRTPAPPEREYAAIRPTQARTTQPTPVHGFNGARAPGQPFAQPLPYPSHPLHRPPARQHMQPQPPTQPYGQPPSQPYARPIPAWGMPGMKAGQIGRSASASAAGGVPGGAGAAPLGFNAPAAAMGAVAGPGHTSMDGRESVPVNGHGHAPVNGLAGANVLGGAGGNASGTAMPRPVWPGRAARRWGL